MQLEAILSGTAARLYILDFGLFQVHQNGRVIGIPGYLIQTQAGENILVDTGFPARYAIEAAQASRDDGLGSFGQILSLTPDNLPAGQLSRLGLTVADIDRLVLTHSDIDHVGGLADFVDRPIFVGQAERALPQPRYFGDRSPLAWPSPVDYRRVAEDQALCPGVALLTTPGHSPGHLSLLVQLPETGPVLLIGDAVSRPAELSEGFGGAWNQTQARASADKLMALAKQTQALVIYGHDPEQWPTLRKAPQFYE